MTTLLLEILTEEIPAGYIEPALGALASRLSQRLQTARIDHGKVRTFGTPRRLAIEVAGLSERQKPVSAEILGPPQSVGYDERGRPQLAALKFAEKAGVSVGKLQIRKTSKGPYLCAIRTEKGARTRMVLKTILPEVIGGIPFPKTMRWADRRVSFARPIHSIIALLGSRVVPFQLDGIRSGRFTSGHRFVTRGKLALADARAYVDTLRDAFVLADIDDRKRRIAADIYRVAAGLGGAVLPDPELLNVVKNLVEFPAAVAGSFDRRFLELPREILITAMREHQKYFSVVNGENRLLPYFIAVNNTPAKNIALVAKGHERVLRARLEDAQFFFKSDLNTNTESRLNKLQGVLFQARLGSMHEKVVRIEQLVTHLARSLDLDDESHAQVVKAARLCKTDLVSQVVGEFPKLQGIMGRIYALASGEPEAVAWAIEEHYKPTFSGGALPETTGGAVLGIADKMDTICGCFRVGLSPTGDSDPYALRRQGIGVIQIIREKRFPISLKTLIRQSLSLYREDKPNIDALTDAVYGFFQNRMAQLLADEGFPKDLVAAVAGVSVDHVPDVWNRVSALSALKAAPDFEPLAIAFKRVVNILRQAKQKAYLDEVEPLDEHLFREPCESALLEAFRRIRGKVRENLEQGRFEAALRRIASLREPVDAFFDGVMVLAEDEALRNNRLALLRQVAGLFETFADFSKISA